MSYTKVKDSKERFAFWNFIEVGTAAFGIPGRKRCGELIIFFGFIVILTVLFMPGGLETIPDKVRSLVDKYRNNRKEAPADAVTYHR